MIFKKYINIYTINGLIHFTHTSNLRMSTFQNLNAQRYEPPSQMQRGQLPGLEETGVDTKMWALGSQGAIPTGSEETWSPRRRWRGILPGGLFGRPRCRVFELFQI